MGLYWHVFSLVSFNLQPLPWTETGRVVNSAAVNPIQTGKPSPREEMMDVWPEFGKQRCGCCQFEIKTSPLEYPKNISWERWAIRQYFHDRPFTGGRQSEQVKNIAKHLAAAKIRFRSLISYPFMWRARPLAISLLKRTSWGFNKERWPAHYLSFANWAGIYRKLPIDGRSAAERALQRGVENREDGFKKFVAATFEGTRFLKS